MRAGEALEHLALAEIYQPGDSPAARKASGSSAVLAAIAAADAVCCGRVKRRSADTGHAAAVELLRQVSPEGPALAKALSVAIKLKTAMQYGTDNVSESEHTRLMRAAERLVRAAQTIL
ncbi:MAG: hypothetical protein ACYDC9_05095 [Dermatophilaceae bacterium]